MREAGFDALVVSEPEAFRYVTGASLGVAAMFRRAGAAFGILPADPALPLGAVVGDLTEADIRGTLAADDVEAHPWWIETVDVSGHGGAIETAIAGAFARRPAGFARPATFDIRAAAAALGRLLARRGLATGRIGLDLDFVSVTDFAAIRSVLPAATLGDGSGVLDRLRMVKAPGEVATLRRGASLAQAGLRAGFPGLSWSA